MPVFLIRKLDWGDFWVDVRLPDVRRERDYDDIDEEDPFNPRARRVGSQNPNLTNMHSFCSYSSSQGSQSSLHPPAPAVSNAPAADYM